MPHRLMRWFDWRHLKPDLRQVSVQFHGLATWLDKNLPTGAEKHAAMRRLLEAKDAAVRARIEGLEKAANADTSAD